MKKNQKKHDLNKKKDLKKFRTRNKSTRNQKNNLKEAKKKFKKSSFISIINGIVFICGYCMLGLNLQLLPY